MSARDRRAPIETSRSDLAAGLVSELRSPLARIELAVSQLRRELATPSARELAACISEAVCEADREIERILPLLDPHPRAVQGSELGGVLARLRERVAPVLEARGIALELGESTAAPLRGDARLVEQAALALVRVGSSLVVSEGWLELGLTSRDDHLAVTLRGRCAEADGGEDPTRVFATLLPWAARHGGELSSEGTHSSWRTSIWLPREVA